MFKNLNLQIHKGDKVAFVGRNDLAKTSLFQILMGEMQADEGSFKWGVSTSRAYFPKDNKDYFNTDLDLIDWLRQYSKEKDEGFIRGFLGRMLFSGEESLKSVRVLSGGEKVRCMLSRMMLVSANVLILDEPTNHLDLESITALNKGLEGFYGTVLFSSHDHQFVHTVANRIVEITPLGFLDKVGITFDEYISDERIKQQRDALYQ
jgi:ATPase subunit of ABC transporter with duplicated ATPase domains